MQPEPGAVVGRDARRDRTEQHAKHALKRRAQLHRMAARRYEALAAQLPDNMDADAQEAVLRLINETRW